MRGCERRGADRGFVTAESAVVLPVLVMFAMALVWGLLVIAAQIQCVDAARTGARAAARQDPDGAVVAVTREAAPAGAKVTVTRTGDQVRVAVVAKPPALGGLPFEVREEAVASAEEAVAGPGPETGAELATGSGSETGAVPETVPDTATVPETGSGSETGSGVSP